MNQTDIFPKRVLISVSDKNGIIDFAHGLRKLNIDIISTGGTSQLLRSAGIPIQDVCELTQFPEMMDGRVKTLHPKIHGGILGKRDTHSLVAQHHAIHWIDLVIVNLYPFAEVIKKPNVSQEEVIENIDIGGPALIRGAAKNREWVGVITDPNDYGIILQELQERKSLSFATRLQLATKAFAYTSQYDACIHHYLEDKKFPDQFTIHLEKWSDLRYGENPHQVSSAYSLKDNTGILSAKQHQGKQLSFNNIVDADAALACVSEFKEPACVIVKHANPCGVAIADNLEHAFQKAYAADAQSAFGGIIALNQTCTLAIAKAMEKLFFELIIAPDYTPEALTLFAEKNLLRVLELAGLKKGAEKEFKFVQGGVLVQDKNNSLLQSSQLKLVTKTKPSEAEIKTMLFAWQVIKHLKSNAILIAKENTTVGIGVGQVSRIDAVNNAVEKAGDEIKGSVLASDAFFPFRDSIDRLADRGVKAIIQPGGSKRDAEVIAACDEFHIAMVFTGERCFRH